MDGVLIFTEDLHKKIYTDALHENNVNISEEEYFKFISGRKAIDALKDILELKGQEIGLVPKIFEEVKALKRKLIHEDLRKYIPLREGTIEFFQSLKSGYKIALATSTVKEFTDLILDEYDIRKYFDTILTAENATKGKPNPEIYNNAAKSLDIDQNECLVFEDKIHGIESAQNAGMKCIALNNGLDVDLSIADEIIYSFNDITIEKIESMNK